MGSRRSFLAQVCERAVGELWRAVGAVLEAPYTEAVDHRPPLTQMHELEPTSLRIVVVVVLLTTRVGNM